MPRSSKILSISLPPRLVKAIDQVADATEQTRSELMRNALREYLMDQEEDRKRFIDAYKATRKEKKYTLSELKKLHKL